MLVDLEVFYLGHLKNLYTIQYNTIQYTQSEITTQHCNYFLTWFYSHFLAKPMSAVCCLIPKGDWCKIYEWLGVLSIVSYQYLSLNIFISSSTSLRFRHFPSTRMSLYCKFLHNLCACCSICLFLKYCDCFCLFRFFVMAALWNRAAQWFLSFFFFLLFFLA